MRVSRSGNSTPEQDAVQRPVEEHYTFEDHNVFPLARFFRVVWIRLWLVVLVAVLFAGAALGFTLIQPPMYQASVVILVGQNQGFIEDPAAAQGLEQVTQTVVATVGSRSVAEEVITRLDLKMTPKDLLDNLTAEQIPSTQLIQLDYKDSNPERSREVANTVAEVFSRRIAGLKGSGSSSITVTVWEEAVTPNTPVGPRPKRNGVLALVLGGFAGVCLAFLAEYLGERSGKPTRRGPEASPEKGDEG
jgi:capsular polysaccharide biosynthesis protein